MLILEMAESLDRGDLCLFSGDVSSSLDKVRDAAEITLPIKQLYDEYIIHEIFVFLQEETCTKPTLFIKLDGSVLKCHL